LKTEDLVTLLARGLEPVNPGSGRRRFLLAWAAGIALSVVLLAGTLRINAALSRELLLGMFWVRTAFCVSLALLAVSAVLRLGRPGARLGLLPVGLALPVIAMWVLAATILIRAAPSQRLPLVLGHTALVCPVLITLLASPVFAALIWALRGFAPTRLHRAGAAAGFAAGAAGALVYTLHCPELAAPFLGIWYLLGMLIAAVLGGLLGPRLLRW
jgi:hypothetical protein